MPNLHRFKVGSLYHPNHTSWTETATYQWRGGQHDYVWFMASPKPREIAAVRVEPCEFGLYVDGPAIFFQYHFPSACAWSDAPFSWHLVPKEEQLPIPIYPLEGLRPMLNITLVDATTGIIKALRLVSLSPEFGNVLHKAIIDQSRAPWTGREAYDRHIADVYSRLSSEQMAAASIATCHGGD